MIIYLKDANGVIYTFNSTFKLEGTPFKIKVNAVEIAYAHGSVDTGDGMIQERYVKLTGTIYASSDADYETAMKALLGAIYKQDQQLYYDTDKYINIKKTASFSPSNPKGADLRAAQVEIQFICENPFWYYNALSSNVKSIAESPETWEVYNNGNVEVHQIISIRNNGTYIPIILQNLAGESLMFGYNDFAFIAGATIVLDCGKGTVKRGDTNTIRYFNGAFPALEAGSNMFLLTGLTAGSVIMEWHRRQL